MEGSIRVSSGVERECPAELRESVEAVNTRGQDHAAQVHSGQVVGGGLSRQLIVGSERSGVRCVCDTVIDVDAAVDHLAGRETGNRRSRGQRKIAINDGGAGVRDSGGA